MTSRERVPALDCDDLARRLWDYVDGRLSPSALAELDAHVAVCANCPGLVAFARVLRRALADLRDRGDEMGMLSTHGALRARLRVALTEAHGRHG